MSLGRHILTLAVVFALSVTVFGNSGRPAKCDVEISIIDNEGGETVDAPEFLAFRENKIFQKKKAESGKILFKDLKDGIYGFLAISEGFRNSFFRMDLDCGNLAGSNRKEVLLPLWKGGGDKTIVLEFADGTDYLQLKPFGSMIEKGSDSPDGATKIASGVVNGRAIKLFRPEYPEAARSMHIRGAAQVKITIGFEGKVESAEFVDGHKLFKSAVIDAAKRSEFAPTFLQGVPVKVEGILVYAF